MLLRPQRAGWGGWSPAFGSFGGERQNSGVIAARPLEDLGVRNSTLDHIYLRWFSLALWIGVMLMADSLNHRQGFLLGGNLIFLSVNTLYLCHVLKLRLFSRFGGSSPHHHNDHGTNCGFYPFLFIVFHFEVWQKKYVDYLTDTSENIRRPCLISIFKFPSIQLFDRSEVLNGSGRRTGVVAGSVATLGTCLRWPRIEKLRKREDQNLKKRTFAASRWWARGHVWTRSSGQNLWGGSGSPDGVITRLDVCDILMVYF